MSNDKPMWDTPTNVKSSPDEAGELARKYDISPDRAQMLIDRLGHDAQQLEDAALALSVKQKSN